MTDLPSLFARLGPVIAGMPIDDAELRQELQNPNSEASLLLRGLCQSARRTLEEIGTTTFSNEEREYMEMMAPYRVADDTPWRMPRPDQPESPSFDYEPAYDCHGIPNAPIEISSGEFAMAGYRGRTASEREGREWTLEFGNAIDLRRKFAEYAYGDPNRVFSLWMLVIPTEDSSDLVQVELDLSPLPTANDAQITITFPTGDCRTLAVNVPPRSSEPCDPVPASAIELKGNGIWLADVWPPHLFFVAESS